MLYFTLDFWFVYLTWHIQNLNDYSIIFYITSWLQNFGFKRISITGWDNFFEKNISIVFEIYSSFSLSPIILSYKETRKAININRVSVKHFLLKSQERYRVVINLKFSALESRLSLDLCRRERRVNSEPCQAGMKDNRPAL